MDRMICIAGPTASGKTELAVALALALEGEVVSCDSMQVYRHMNIGTAKPTLEEIESLGMEIKLNPTSRPPSLPIWTTHMPAVLTTCTKISRNPGPECRSQLKKKDAAPLPVPLIEVVKNYLMIRKVATISMPDLSCQRVLF